MADSYIEQISRRLTDRVITMMKLNVPGVNDRPLAHRAFYRQLIYQTILKFFKEEGIE